jgi:hypothetical protein
MVMDRELRCFLVAGLLLVGSSETSALGQAKQEANQVQSAEVKEAVLSLGTGEAGAIDVTLIDKSIGSGYVFEADGNSFVVVNPVNETRVRVGYGEVKRLRAENPATRANVSVPRERPKVVGAAVRLATLAIPGHRRVETSSNRYLSKPAIVVLVVLAVGLILIGVELGKS